MQENSPPSVHLPAIPMPPEPLDSPRLQKASTVASLEHIPVAPRLPRVASLPVTSRAYRQRSPSADTVFESFKAGFELPQRSVSAGSIEEGTESKQDSNPVSRSNTPRRLVPILSLPEPVFVPRPQTARVPSRAESALSYRSFALPTQRETRDKDGDLDFAQGEEAAPMTALERVRLERQRLKERLRSVQERMRKDIELLSNMPHDTEDV